MNIWPRWIELLSSIRRGQISISWKKHDTTQLAFSSNFYWKICFKFCILEQIIATVLFICISSINNKRSLLRFQSTTAPTNRGWSACALALLFFSKLGKVCFLTWSDYNRCLSLSEVDSDKFIANDLANDSKNTVTLIIHCNFTLKSAPKWSLSE